jgi:hypothetical protein
MPFAVTAERQPHYIRFNVAGPASLKNYFDLIEAAARETLENGDKIAMVDLRRVIGRLNFTDQFFIGDVVGQKLAHLERLASLVPGDPSSYNSETVANRKGLNLRSFDSEERALAWLSERREAAARRA